MMTLLQSLQDGYIIYQRKLFLPSFAYKHKSELQVLSFIFILILSRCSLPLKLMTFVLHVLKCCMLYPLALTHLFFFVKCGHVQGT
ncbi:hypothetical protein Hanom_Chr09g00805921 [Helianthus anomalus]